MRATSTTTPDDDDDDAADQIPLMQRNNDGARRSNNKISSNSGHHTDIAGLDSVDDDAAAVSAVATSLSSSSASNSNSGAHHSNDAMVGRHRVDDYLSLRHADSRHDDANDEDINDEHLHRHTASTATASVAAVVAIHDVRATDNDRRYNAEFDAVRKGRFHWLAAAALGLGNASDAVEVLAIGYILTAYEEQEGSITGFWKGFLAAAVFLGMLLGGLVCGVLSDRVGRRPALLVSLLLNSAAALASAFSPNLAMLIAMRIVAGIGVGGSIPSVFTLTSELMPTSHRGFFIVVVAWHWTFGSMLTAGIAWLVLGYYGLSWRVFAAVCCAPAAVAALACSTRFVPESPRHDMTQRRYAAAAATLSRIARFNGQPADVVDARLAAFVAACEASDVLASKQRERRALTRQLRLQQLAAGDCDGDTGSGDDVDSGGERSGASSSDVSAAGRAKHQQTRQQKKKKNRKQNGTKRGGDGGVGDVRRGSLNTGLLSASQSKLTSSSSSSSLQSSLSVSLSLDAGAHTSDGDGGGGLVASLTSVRLLYHSSIIRSTLILQLCWFTLSFGSYGLSVWIPQLFKQVGFENSAYQDAFMYAAAAMPGNLLSAALIESPRVGRRRLMAGSMCLAALSALLFAVSQQSVNFTVGVACLFSACAISGWNALDCLSTETFPTTVRSSAMGLLTASGRLGSILAQFVNSALLSRWQILLLVTSANMFIGGIVTLALPTDGLAQRLADRIVDDNDDDDDGQHDHDAAAGADGAVVHDVATVMA